MIRSVDVHCLLYYSTERGLNMFRFRQGRVRLLMLLLYYSTRQGLIEFSPGVTSMNQWMTTKRTSRRTRPSRKKTCVTCIISTLWWPRRLSKHCLSSRFLSSRVGHRIGERGLVFCQGLLLMQVTLIIHRLHISRMHARNHSARAKQAWLCTVVRTCTCQAANSNS